MPRRGVSSGCKVCGEPIGPDHGELLFSVSDGWIHSDCFEKVVAKLKPPKVSKLSKLSKGQKKPPPKSGGG